MGQSKIMTEGKNLAVIALGITVYSLGFCAFILPHEVVVGGMAGFSTLVYYATACKVPVAVTMYGANLLLLALGWKQLGKAFVARTIYGATLMSLIIGAVEGYFVHHPPLVTSAPVSIAIGAVIMGFGIGLYYSHHGTAGGTDIVAAIMAGRTNVTMGRVMMVVDFSIVTLSFLLPFDGDMEERLQARAQTIIFGWIAIFVYSYIADRYVNSGRQTLQLMVISKDWEAIARQITHETGRGVTFWKGTGYWTGEGRTLMMLWCRRYNLHDMLRIIYGIDPGAYIATTYVNEIFGNGFDHLRVKSRAKSY